ncbi:unnamed protein product [Toxocara canis]|uniref:Acetylcholine receptor subunit alpha-type des-2 n=1 Tax=Toxocara canis TaxID=6265 RepID=A0A3P7GBU0_TOXCA|nr:unnamed protein product [Toxocara canis]
MRKIHIVFFQNEPQQYILLNAWIIERWYDEFLFWLPSEYENITEIRLPYDSIWLPDTTLYNSLVMKDEDSRRLLNAKLTTNTSRRAAFIELLYPTIYKFSCLLNLRFFPFDVQICTMTFSSWTYDQKGINYFPFSSTIGTSNYIENEGWHILRTSGWFILGMIAVISLGTLASSVVIAVQKRGHLGERLSVHAVNITKVFAFISLTAVPLHLKKGTKKTADEKKLKIVWWILLGGSAPNTNCLVQIYDYPRILLMLVVSKIRASFRHFQESAETPKPEVYRKSVKISNKLSRCGHHKKPWLSFTKRDSSPMADIRGVSFVSDKSTDLLMSPSTLSDTVTQPLVSLSNADQQYLSPDDILERDIPSITLPPPPPPPAPPSAPSSPLEDDLNSAAESDTVDSARPPPPPKREPRVNQANMLKHLSIFTGNVKQSRKLALQEYEWLATVVERCCFIVFVIIFLTVTFGINALAGSRCPQLTINGKCRCARNSPPMLLPIFVSLMIPAHFTSYDHFRYDTRIRPINNHSDPLKIHISMSLYQIIDVNEPSQNIKVNMWMIQVGMLWARRFVYQILESNRKKTLSKRGRGALLQKWSDELLDWDPHEYGMINSTILPHSSLWIPDTYMYNSVVMSRDETERYMNVQVSSRYWDGKPGANISFLYPAIYTITCRLNVRYFPYDQQNCTLTISSWTNSKSALDYYADDHVNMQSFIPNEEWDVMSFNIYRHEYKYACCAEPWVIIEASLIIRRKPLYYVVNLIIPTSIITIVAITGFFTPASTSDDRTEKINLGITTLLAMSILMLMVSDQMPTTSEFVPLIAWFYLSIIIIISIGTFLTSIILGIQGRRQFGKMPSQTVRIVFFVYVAHWMCLSVPTQLLQFWEEFNVIFKQFFSCPNGRYSDHPANLRFLRKSRGKEDNKVHKNGAGSPHSGKGAKLDFNFPNAQAMFRRTADGSSNIVSKTGIERPPQAVQPTPEAPLKKSNWLKIPANAAAIIEERARFPSIDASNASSPKSPNSPSSRHGSLWESAMALVGLSNDTKPPKASIRHGSNCFFKDRMVSNEVIEMKRKRQCCLEWEFLATILDRVLLILFTLAVIVVTMGLIITGHMAQHDYIS